MGTRAIIKTVDEIGQNILTLYRHWDGYPSAVIPELNSFIEDFKKTRGIDISYFSARLVQRLLNDHGDGFLGYGIWPHDHGDCWQEYIYLIKPTETDYIITIDDKPLSDWNIEQNELLSITEES